MKHKIELKPAKILSDGGYPIYRGSREVLVDGYTWGFIDCKFVGCHGTVNTLCQVIDYSERLWETILDSDRKRPSPKYKEWSDKQYKFHVDPNVPRQSLEERLLVAVETAIKKGDLRDPVDVNAEHEEKHRKWRADVAREEKAAADRIDARARRVLAVCREDANRGTVSEEKMVAEIKAAMEWAKENA